MNGQADYEIVARLVVKDGSRPGTAGATHAIDQVERRAKAAGVSIGSVLGRAFMGLATGAGILAATRGILGIHRAAEDAHVGIAGLLNASTGMGMAKSLGVAQGVLRDLRTDAKKGAGELSNYRDAFQLLSTPGLQSGKSIGDIREMGRLAISTGAAMRGTEGARLAPLDIMQSLQGGASTDTTPIAAQALTAAGVSLKKFNAMGQPDKWNALLKGFGAYGPAIEAMSKTWSAQTGTLKDNLVDIVRVVTAPLFDRWKDSLIRINEWLDKNSEAIQAMAEKWGVRLLALWDHLVDRAGTYAALVAGAAILPRLGGMGPSGTPIRQGAAAGIYGLMQRGGFTGPASNRMGTALGELFTKGGITAALGGVGASLSSIAAVAVPVGVALAAIAGLLGGVFGALEQWPSVLGMLSESAAYAWSGIMAVVDSFGSLFEGGSVLNLAGLGLLQVVGWLLDGFGALARVLATVLRVITAPFDGTSWADAKSDIAGYWAKPLAGQGAIEAAAAAAAGGRAPQQVTNINGDINVRVEREVNADPDRVAFTFEQVLERARRSPTAARRIPALTLG